MQMIYKPQQSRDLFPPFMVKFSQKILCNPLGCDQTVLCTSNIVRIPPPGVTTLVYCHDRLILRLIF